MKNNNQKEYLERLEGVVKQMLIPLKNLPFNLVISAMSGFKVILFSPKNKQHIKVLECLKKVCEDTIKNINKNGINSNRPNELGNYVEPFIKNSLNKYPNCKAGTPTTTSGARKSTGYPDIVCLLNDYSFYVECKTYNLNNINSTQRSFYFSPSESFKVTKDSLHLLVSFEVVVIKEKLYKVNGYKIYSLDSLSLDVKYEFNADNRRMYSGNYGTLLLAEKQNLIK